MISIVEIHHILHENSHIWKFKTEPDFYILIRPPKAVKAAFPRSMRVALAKPALAAFGGLILKSGSIFNFSQMFWSDSVLLF